MTDQKKPEAVTDADLESAQGGLYTTSAAGTELYSTSAAGTELFSTDAGTMEARQRLKKKDDGSIVFDDVVGI